MDQAMGIHTNGGCSTGGGGSSNNGTPITAVALQNALANPKGVCKLGDGFADLGQDKKETPFNRFPSLSACGDLSPGSSLTVELTIPISSPAVGFSMTAILFVGLSELSAPFAGGILVPNPDFSLTFPVDTATRWTPTSRLPPSVKPRRRSASIFPEPTTSVLWISNARCRAGAP